MALIHWKEKRISAIWDVCTIWFRITSCIKVKFVDRQNLDTRSNPEGIQWCTRLSCTHYLTIVCRRFLAKLCEIHNGKYTVVLVAEGIKEANNDLSLNSSQAYKNECRYGWGTSGMHTSNFISIILCRSVQRIWSIVCDGVRIRLYMKATELKAALYRWKFVQI